MDMVVTRRLAHRFGISLGGDNETFKVLAFKAEERLSETFRLQIELSSRKSDVDIDALLEKDALLTIEDEGPTSGEPRYFHGKITGFKQVSIEADGDSGHAFYSVTIEPDLALLKLAQDVRMYQQRTVREIAEDLLKEGGVRKVKWLVTRALQPRSECGQWQETNFQFFQRLMSECGIWWYFIHTKDGHELVLTDRVEGAGELKPESIEYNGTPGGNADKAFIYHFAYQKEIGAGKAMQRDYHFRNPRYNYQSSSHAGPERDQARELYFYPGRYKRDETGKDYTRMWLESHRAPLERGEGASNIHQLVPGHTTSLTGYRDPYNCKYLIVSALHEGTQPQSAEEGAGEQQATEYNNTFVVIPETIPFRPPQHQKPKVDGALVGIVTGPEGEEIFTDEYGRVKVYLNLDRRDKKDDSSSCWIRVSQGWAGPLYGQIAIPRVGHEVLVEFLDGDFDRPYISGRSYHDANRPPYKLPEFKTRTGIVTKSHKGNGYNELRLEDEQNQEEWFLRAEKYFNAEIKDDETWQTGGSRHKRVDKDQSESIGGAKDIEVKGSHTEVIEGGMSLKVESIRKAEVGKPDMGGQDHLIVHGDQAERVKGNWTRHVGRNIRMESNAHQQFKAPGTIFLDAGDQVVLRAGSIVSLNVGGNFIRIDAGGVTIEGTNVNINQGKGSPAKGKDVPMIEPEEANKYQGPYAERYERSFKK